MNSLRHSDVEDSAAAAALDADNPWPGLASFTEAQSARFFGRDAEIKALARRIQGDPLTVLFGQSGLGKSSLLQAGVFPRLRSADFCPVYIRLDHAPGAPSPVEQTKLIVRTETARAGRWTRPELGKPGESLWEFFHHRDNRLVSPGGITLAPVLVFDQFEELFTLGAGGSAERERAVAFITGLAELVENRPPATLEARLEDSDAELDAFDFRSADYRVIITLREDYLPHLESLKTIMPTLMDNRMRLTRMNGVQALEAVLRPAPGLVTEEVGRTIVEFVSGARGGSAERLAELEVEPPLLSVICHELNERRRKLGQPQIAADLVTGNRREILTDFYERSVADLPEAMRRFVEDKLLTKSGFRDNLALETALEEPGVTRPLIDTLVSRRLLRIEDRIGTQRVELTHDVLAEVIRASRDTRQQRLALERERQREHLTRRRMWLARTIAAGLLVVCAGVSWIAWRAIRAERAQSELREREATLRREAQIQEGVARRKAYASDMSALQHALKIDNLGRARELLNRQRPKPGEVDLRGWEWRYLWQFCRSDPHSVVKAADNDSVLSVAVSADGAWIAAGSYGGGNVRLLDRTTGESLRIVAGDADSRVAFSPREPLLAYTLQTTRGAREEAEGTSPVSPVTNRLVLWDVARRTARVEIQIGGRCNGLVFSDDGERIAVSEQDTRAITVWRVVDGSLLARHPGGYVANSFFCAFAATRDLALAAVPGNPSRRLRVIDLTKGRLLWEAEVTDQAQGTSAVAFSKDGQMVASGSGLTQSTIRLWDARSGRALGELEGHRAWITSLAFLDDGKHLVSTGADQIIRVWDVSTRKLVRTLRGHDTEVWRVGIVPGQNAAASGCKDGSVYMWDLFSDSVGTAEGTIPQVTVEWTFQDEGEAIVFMRNPGRLMKRQGVAYASETELLTLDRDTAVPLILHPGQNLVAARMRSGAVQIWDWQRKTLVREFAASPDGPTTPRHFAADGSRLMVTVERRGIFTQRELELRTGREGRAVDVALPPSLSGTVRYAYGADDNQVVIIPFAPGEGSRIEFATGAAQPISFTIPEVRPFPRFSPDGKLLAVTSARGFAVLYETAGFKEVARFRGYMFGVHSPAFSPDMKRLATGSTGVEALVVWDLESRERVLTLEGRVGALLAASFSREGNVVGGVAAGQFKFWRAPSWAEIEAAEQHAVVKASQ